MEAEQSVSSLTVEDETSHAIAGVKLLAGNLLGAGHEALGTIDLDDQRPTLVAVAGSGDDLALPLRELLEQAVALVFPEFLDHHLLGRLGRDAAETLQRDVLALALIVVAPDLDLARRPVDMTAELFGIEGVEVLACGAHHRLLEILDEQVTINISITGDRVENAQCVRIHGSVLFSC